MKQTIAGIILILISFFFSSFKTNRTFTENEIAIVPQVNEMTLGESSFSLKRNTRFVVENAEQKAIASQFAILFEKTKGWKLSIVVRGGEGSNQIDFKSDATIDPEGYKLEVKKDRITIKASQPAGFFYATQTLRQLLPPEIESAKKLSRLECLIPVVSIKDKPAFPWRGYMLDVSRHFFTKDEVLSMIDNLALHKINTLHLHLVDDQGWRIEIKKYPKLTQIGAWRVDREDKHWWSRTKQEAGEKATYGGFYTQADIKEMVAYAKARYIDIVPEIEMPGHVTSALAAYPQFSCKGNPLTVPPGVVWPITDIYCAGKDSTFLFLEDVLSEVIDLFPSKYIHIGGDEANKTEWEKCPDCKRRIKNEGLKDAAELQSYFIKRIEKFINSKGRILLGWDEILEGGLPPQATVMSWRGIKGGVEAVKQGHDVVMTPNSHCYLDFYQGAMDQEPLAIGGCYISLSAAYSFNPIPEELNDQEAKHILGGQGALWTEYISNIKHAQYMTFPRLAALAEALWSKKEIRNWDDFSRRIRLIMKRYDKMGINYSKSAFNVTAKRQIDAEKKQLTITLACELSGVEIRYTTDGTEPNAQSALYKEPLVLNQTATLKAVTVINGNPAGKVLTQSFNMNKATFKPVKYLNPCDKNFPGWGKYTLVNGICGTLDFVDGEWQGWQGLNAELIIDLQQLTEIKTISASALQNQIWPFIFLPKKVEFFVSDDGYTFRKVGEAINDIDPLSVPIQRKVFTASFNPVSASFIKVVVENLGKRPKGHLNEGEPASLFIDEIIVE